MGGGTMFTRGGTLYLFNHYLSLHLLAGITMANGGPNPMALGKINVNLTNKRVVPFVGIMGQVFTGDFTSFPYSLGGVVGLKINFDWFIRSVRRSVVLLKEH